VSESFELPSVDSITFGTVGPAGQRVFYVQARSGATTVTIKAEKQQVSGLSSALRALLADLPPLPDVLTIQAPELVEPVEAPWAVGGIGLSAFEEMTQRVTLLLEELVPGGDDDGEDDGIGLEGATARFGLTMPQMRALAERGEVLVAGGRPPCPLCGSPMNPDGHACPKTNGHLSH
jgi:uncharacterized repeat protein (TIGR03847 family)